MILRSQLITLNQVIIGIGKTTNSLIVRVVCNVGLTVGERAGGRGRCGRREVKRAAAANYVSVEFFGEKTRASVTTPTEHTTCPPLCTVLGAREMTFVPEVA